MNKNAKEKEDELFEINKKFDILSYVTSSILSCATNLDALFNLIVELSIEAVDGEAGSLLILNKEKNILEFKVAKGEKGDEVKKFKIPVGNGIAGWVAKFGIPQIITDPYKDPRFLREISKLIKFPTHSILCVPMKLKEEVVGVIEIINKKNRKGFTNFDQKILSILANQAAIALEKAELFKDNEEKIENLTTLIEIGKVINSKLNRDYVFKTIMRLTANLMKAEAASLLIVDEDAKEMKFESVWGGKEQEIKKIKLKIGEGIAGYVAETGKTLVIPNVQSDKRFYKTADKKTKFKTYSIIAAPLKIKDKTIGVIEALNRKDREDRAFREKDIEIFTALANQSAIALENANLYLNLKNLFLGTVKALVEAIDAKSPYTSGHSERVAKYSKAIAEQLNLTDEEKEIIELAGFLHDIGKIGIDEVILNKPEKLTPQEYDIIKKHPEIGAEIIKPVPNLQNIIPVILHHHERYDGGGYPSKLSGENIPLFAKILAIADAFDAMTSERSYRDKFSDEIALNEIERCTGTQFDPKISKAFTEAWKKGKIIPKYIVS